MQVRRNVYRPSCTRRRLVLRPRTLGTRRLRPSTQPRSCAGRHTVAGVRETITDKSFVRPFELSPGHVSFGRHARTAGRSKRMCLVNGASAPEFQNATRTPCQSTQRRETHSNPFNVTVGKRCTRTIINYVWKIFHVKSPDVLVYNLYIETTSAHTFIPKANRHDRHFYVAYYGTL